VSEFRKKAREQAEVVTLWSWVGWGDILKEVDRDIAARKKLERIAAGSDDDEAMTPDEAARVLKLIKFLGDEREALLSSLPDD
jgi:hypothetical protein